MRFFKAINTNDMAAKVYIKLLSDGIEEDSRNGKVIRFPDPVCLEYTRPWEVCNYTPGRNANPFFHFMEAMWMLAGRRDVEFLSHFNNNIAQYSDDGTVFNAAYGYRLRRHFGFDQLQKAANRLVEEPNTRQLVLQIWDTVDLYKQTKDKACNTQIMLQLNEGHLDMTVHNRSNDAVWGNITGANPVHFAYFLQYLSEQAFVKMGTLRFLTINLHMYLDLYDFKNKMDWDRGPYRTAPVGA